MAYNYLSVGCSHTRSKNVERQHRWQALLNKKTGINFEYLHFCFDASGLFHLYNRLLHFIDQKVIIPQDVRILVLQKPEAIRFPWFHLKSWDSEFSCEYNPRKHKWAYPSNEKIHRGRAISIEAFEQLKNSDKLQVAQFIFNSEKKIIDDIRNIFSNTSIIYWYHWGDQLLTSLRRPELININPDLGRYAENLEIHNWKTVFEKIGKFQTEQTEYLDVDFKKLYQEEWIVAEGDIHPGKRFHLDFCEKMEKFLHTPVVSVYSFV